MERIGNEVKRTISQTGGGQGLALEITAAWPQAVGDAIARHAWPLRLARDGTLHVATASATWAFELDRMSPEIAERLTAVLGEQAPRGLRFRVGPVPEPGSNCAEGVTEVEKEVLETTPEAAAAADLAASAIEDPELRELVARAARASLSSGGSDRGFW